MKNYKLLYWDPYWGQLSTCACTVQKNIDIHPKGKGGGGGNRHSQGDVSFKTP